MNQKTADRLFDLGIDVFVILLIMAVGVPLMILCQLKQDYDETCQKLRNRGA